MTTSASTRDPASSLKDRCLAPKRLARSIACNGVRFMMINSCAPLSQRWWAVSSLIFPEPTSRTHALRVGNSFLASCTATKLTEAALRPIPVSLRARLPATTAPRNNVDVIGPA